MLPMGALIHGALLLNGTRYWKSYLHAQLGIRRLKAKPQIPTSSVEVAFTRISDGQTHTWMDRSNASTPLHCGDMGNSYNNDNVQYLSDYLSIKDKRNDLLLIVLKDVR